MYDGDFPCRKNKIRSSLASCHTQNKSKCENETRKLVEENIEDNFIGLREDKRKIIKPVKWSLFVNDKEMPWLENILELIRNIGDVTIYKTVKNHSLSSIIVI